MIIGMPISASKTQYYINHAYIQYVINAGYSPYLFVPGTDIKSTVNKIDGLLLPGGIDIDPIYYGEDNTSSFAVDILKDEFEREILHAAVNKGIPIMGICRGLQLIAREYLLNIPQGGAAVYSAMDMCDHIPDHNQVDNQQLQRTSFQHFVSCIPEILYKNDKDKTSFPVNSMHHQCLLMDLKKRNILEANGIVPVAWTTRGLKNKGKDNGEVVCEAFRLTKWNSPVLAVQWHPEELNDIELITNFFGGNKNLSISTNR